LLKAVYCGCTMHGWIVHLKTKYARDFEWCTVFQLNIWARWPPIFFDFSDLYLSEYG
jgi:hypothetical protein